MMNQKKIKFTGMFLAVSMVMATIFPFHVNAATNSYWAEKSVIRYYNSSDSSDAPEWKLTRSNDYTYDKHGNVASEVVKEDLMDGIGVSKMTYKHTYKNGKETKRVSYRNGKKVSTRTYTYNKDNTLKATVEKDTEGNITGKHSYTYKEGKLTKDRYKDSSSDICNYYDSKGNLKKTIIIYSYGPKSTVSYDKYGIVTAYTYQNDEGNITQNEKYTLTYKDGLCTKVDPNGEKAVYYITGYYAGMLKEVISDEMTTTYKYTQDKKSKKVATQLMYVDGKLSDKYEYKYIKITK